MVTADLIQEVLTLSGPYHCAKAKGRHRRYLEGHDTQWLLDRKKDLLATSQRAGSQPTLGLRYAR